MEITLYARYMKTREKAHAHIARRLSFPSYYGKNLDALFDLLTDCSDELTIRIKGSERLRGYMDGYGEMIINTIKEASENNPRIKVTLS